jgi:hypothetical protein
VPREVKGYSANVLASSLDLDPIAHPNLCPDPPTASASRSSTPKLYNRLLRPLAAADRPQAPPALRQALAVIDHHVGDHIARARLKPAA